FSQADGLGSNMVRSLRSDRAGRMWVGTDGGGVSVLESGRWRTLTMADGLNNDRIFEILEDRAGRMWFSTLGAGASRWDGRSFTSFGSDEGLSTNELPCPCGSGKKLGECHGPNPGAHVQEFLEDREGRIWFGCSGGLFRLEGDRVINITKDGPWPAIGSATSNEEPDDAPDRDG
ncbi:MAG: two-component regulator propeller domain-containing protein, partial [Phycisphaerales bacterium]